MTRFAVLGAAWDYIYGTFRLRRLVLLALVGLSTMFTFPVFFRFPIWMRQDLVYVYVATAYVGMFWMYGVFRKPVKALIGSIFLGWKYKNRVFTHEQYVSYGVVQILNEMGITKKVKVLATTNPLIEGPFTNAFTNTVYIPASWMDRFPRLEIRGVLGHELGHVKTKGKFEREFGLGMGGVVGLAFVIGLFSITLVTMIFEFALAFLMLTILSWRNERRADMEGAKVTGPEGLISVFEQLRLESKRDDGSETHPPLSDRIAKLSRLLNAPSQSAGG
jgi:Zn-dependent protease with chaperone function